MISLLISNWITCYCTVTCHNSDHNWDSSVIGRNSGSYVVILRSSVVIFRTNVVKIGHLETRDLFCDWYNSGFQGYYCVFENRVKRLRKDNMFSRFAEITIFAACDLTAFRSMRFSQQFSLLRLVPHRVRGIRVQIRKKSLDMISKQKMIRK